MADFTRKSRLSLRLLRRLMPSAWVWALLACGSLQPPPQARSTPATVVRPSAAQVAHGDVLPSSYLVAFRLPPGGPGLAFPNFAAEYRAHFAYLAGAFLSDPRVKDIRVLSAVDLGSALDGVSGDASRGLGMPPYLMDMAQNAQAPLTASLAQVDFSSSADADATLAEWEAAGALWFAEPNFISHVSDNNLFQTYSTTYAKLPYWWLTSVNLTKAYDAIAARDVTQAGTPSDAQLSADRPLIAVLDSGVDYEHPALKGSIWTNTDVNAADCDNDLHGCNTTTAQRGKLGNGDVWPFAVNGPGQSCAGLDDNCSHGTHVAGLIAADATWVEPGSGHSVGGVCPVCQIMILKIVSQVGAQSGILDSSIIAAFKYVTLFRRNGSPAVRVVNASFGKFVRTRSVGLMIRLMRSKNGTVLVGAAGNEDTLTEEFPAAFADAISVAAVDEHLRKDSFSNFGRWVDISAPGDQMLSTVPGAALDTKSGTSMATPMVAGVAGLVVARYPNIGFDDLRNAILLGADATLYSPETAGGYNFNYYYPQVEHDLIRQPLLGFGLVNAAAAVKRQPSQNLPLFDELNRVKPGCSTVGGAASQAPIGAGLLALLLTLPASLAASAQSLQVIRAILRNRRSASP